MVLHLFISLFIAWQNEGLITWVWSKMSHYFYAYKANSWFHAQTSRRYFYRHELIWLSPLLNVSSVCSMSITWLTQNSEEKSVKLIVEWKDGWFLIDFLTKARNFQFLFCLYKHFTVWMFLQSRVDKMTISFSVNITLKMLKVWSVIRDDSNNRKRWKPDLNSCQNYDNSPGRTLNVTS